MEIIQEQMQQLQGQNKSRGRIKPKGTEADFPDTFTYFIFN